jgi:hypothetical protein
MPWVPSLRNKGEITSVMGNANCMLASGMYFFVTAGETGRSVSAENFMPFDGMSSYAPSEVCAVDPPMIARHPVVAPIIG